MRRLLVLLGLGLMVLPAFSACGVERTGNLDGDAGLGGGGSGGTAGIGSGNCFPGSKVCPDPKNANELLCLTADDPNYGCSKATACAPCLITNGTAKCVSGACAVDTCNTGYADCNGDPTDGCETDLSGDKNHCGDCATDCIATKGNNWICENSICIVNYCCESGDPTCLTKRDCDADKTNGCEVDVGTDVNNCGNCGTACNLQHAEAACSQEVCVVTTCHTGYDNCDGNDANGCETNIDSGDKANCGACNKACNETNGGATCTNGTCVLACFPGFGNCDNNPDNGCETNLKTSPLHCNACGNACNPANVVNATCTNGACGFDACDPGYADCDGNKANGCEINTNQDKNHCGNCGTVCTAPSGGSVFCNSGSCAQSCGSLTNCSGVCVNTGNDINNCGGCGTKCNPPSNSTAVCASGACGFNCNPGYAKCGSTTQCFNTQTDPLHCGSCVNCPPPTAGSGTETCTGGSCGITCTGGTPNKCGNGCYNFQNDKNRCGGCGTVCTDPANGVNNCVSGSCQISCNSGFHLCGGQCKANNDPGFCGPSCTNCAGPTSGTGNATCTSNSCGITCTGGTPTLCGSDCVNTQTSEAYCGNCNTACAAQQTCCSGSCKSTQTDPGFCGASCAPCSGATPDCCAGGCTDKQTSEQHCGNCGATCGPPPNFCCGGNCADRSADNNNCGSSCTKCTGGQCCKNGACQSPPC